MYRMLDQCGSGGNIEAKSMHTHGCHYRFGTQPVQLTDSGSKIGKNRFARAGGNGCRRERTENRGRSPRRSLGRRIGQPKATARGTGYRSRASCLESVQEVVAASAYMTPFPSTIHLMAFLILERIAFCSPVIFVPVATIFWARAIAVWRSRGVAISLPKACSALFSSV
jgi:hypothetical protein